MIASTTFQSYSNRPIPLVYMFPLGISTSTVHPRSNGIYPCCHMNWVISTSFCHRSSLGVVDPPSDKYVFCSHFLKLSACRWVYGTALWSWRRRTAASTAPSKGTSPLTLKGVTWVDTGILLGGGGCFFPPIQRSTIPCHLVHVLPRGIRGPCRRVAVPPF